MREYLPTETQIRRVAEVSGVSSALVGAVLCENNRYTRLIGNSQNDFAEAASHRQELEPFRSSLPRIPSEYMERSQWRMQFLVNRLDLDPEPVLGILNAYLSELAGCSRISSEEHKQISSDLNTCSQHRDNYYPADLGAIDRHAILAQHLDRFGPLDRDRKAVILMGPMCTGKTTIHRGADGKGFLPLDAGDLFVAMAGSSEPRFAGPYLAELDAIGRRLLEVGLENGFNVMVEIIGSDANILTAMIAKLRGHDYKVAVNYIHAPFDECVRRQGVRGDDNLSAYFTEGFHQAWVLGIPPW